MNQREYREIYLKSEHWKCTRKCKLIEAGYKCELCRSTFKLEIHHLTYARLGNERMSDLQVLCRDCHDAQHKGKISYTPMNQIEADLSDWFDEGNNCDYFYEE